MHAFVPTIACPSHIATRSAWTGSRPTQITCPAVRRATVRRAQIRAATPVEAEADNFESEVLQSELPVLVDFYAPWCGPCKLVAPLMEWAAMEFDGRLKVVKVETKENDDFVKKYNIHGLPTLAVFKGGEPFGLQEGAIGKEQLQKYIRKHVPELAEA